MLGKGEQQTAREEEISFRPVWSMGEGRNYWVGQKVRSKAKLKQTFWPTCSTISILERRASQVAQG